MSEREGEKSEVLRRGKMDEGEKQRERERRETERPHTIDRNEG